MGRTGIGLVWLCFCCTISASLSQFVNVAMGKTCNQSSTYDASHPPSYAANGNTDGTYDSRRNCIHTDDSDYKPWWEVDLGRTYPVYNITVWARASQMQRLYPLSITVDGRQCVSATSTGNRKQDLSCASLINGQVVRLTRGHKTGEDRFLNLCEVEIWVCQDGYYLNGNKCVPCSNYCLNSQCDSTSGTCNGCITGYHGDQCNSPCSSITTQCSRCTQDGQCTGCSGNFQSPLCTACQDKYYLSGNTCHQCSSNCNDRRCNPNNGCVTNRWGNKCENSCSSYCATNTCNRGTGKCNGCRTGYHGDQCNSPCSSITPQCSRCTQDGQCTGCSGNFQSPQCTDCLTGYYGEQCNYLCSSRTARCYKCTRGGVCTECTNNFKFPNCTGCKSGYYGDHCNIFCSMITSQCSECTQEGQCSACNSTNFQHPQCTGCVEGYYGDQCNILCSARTNRCTQCTRDGQCTDCSGNFQSWQCTACKERYYKSGSSCVKCSSNCLNFQCDPDSGMCYKTLDEEKENLIGPVVGAVVGFIVCCSIVAIVYFLWRRRQFNGRAGKTTAVEMTSADTINNQSDSVRDLPSPSSSNAAIEGSVYEIVENDNDRNNGHSRQPAKPTPSSTAGDVGSVYEIDEAGVGRNNGLLRQPAEPPSPATAGDENRYYENEIQVNTYDKFCPYANDDGDRELYTELADAAATS